VALRHIHVGRYREILAVFAKYGFGLALERLGIYRHLKMKNRIFEQVATDKASSSAGTRLRLALEELGPAFVKIGQILSTRPDIVSPGVIEELKLLQDAVQPFSFAEVKAVIEEEFAEKLENIFQEFAEKPFAAASMAQVHCARLLSGEFAAVKVQRPGIEKTIAVDLDILKSVAHFIDLHTKYGELYNFSETVADFENIIKNELDFLKEAENAEVFRRNLAQDEGIKVPHTKKVYTTRRVLTMEYIDGVRIDDNYALDDLRLDRTKLAEKLAASICRQILRDGFFHADPHPGNIQVLKDGTIVFLDLGMVGRLSESRKRMISDFFVGVASKDSYRVIKALVDMERMPKRSNIRNFEYGVELLIEKYLTRPMKEIRIDQLFAEVFPLAYAHHIRIPREFILLAKTLGTLQGLLEKLAPDLNAFTVVEPIAKKLLRQSLSTRRLAYELNKTLYKYKDLFNEFPGAMMNFLGKMEDEDFTVQFQLKDIDKLEQLFVQVLNRIFFSMVLLAVSIIIAGIIIGSSINSGLAREIHSYNIYILRISLVLAAVIVAGLVVSLFKSRRLK
jgi:ubiquinone biosynthesis protein